MDPRDKEKIQVNYKALISNTKWNPQLRSELVTRKIFTEKLVAQLKFDQDPNIEALFAKVQKRGPTAFQNLVEALRDSQNLASAQILDPTISLHADIRLSNNLLNPGIPVQNPKDFDQPLDIRVKVTGLNISPLGEAYEVSTLPKGQCLIIDIEDFENELHPRRKGSHVDSTNLAVLFSQLGFQVRVTRNLSYSKLNVEITEFASSEKHVKGSMCIVICLSHGTKDYLYTTDGKKIEIEWLLKQFNNDYCEWLQGKPKFFMFQACRGDDRDYGSKAKKVNTDETDAVPINNESNSFIKTPSWEDYLIANATIPGYVAHRNTQRGSWFVECVCQVFMEHAHDTDIRDMLDKVGLKMRNNYESNIGTFQTSTHESRHFYKKLYFNPTDYEGTIEYVPDIIQKEIQV